MELKLEHLVPYLLHGVSFYVEHKDGTPMKPWTMTIDSDLRQIIEFQNKPILRPLSDLAYDYPSNNLKKGGFNGWLTKECIDDIHNVKGIGQLKLYQSMYLFGHHFDVFGLIDKGLAIDVNTIKPSLGKDFFKLLND